MPGSAKENRRPLRRRNGAFEARRHYVIDALERPRTQAELRDALGRGNRGILHLLRHMDRDGLVRSAERVFCTRIWERAKDRDRAEFQTVSCSRERLLSIYGPFNEGGGLTGHGNAAFDADLRRRNLDWGLRDREAVDAAASAQGFLVEPVSKMPANNRMLVYRRP